MKIHVLDANALYRFLTDGPGAEIIARLFREARDAGQPLRMSVVNWGEVYYTIARVKGLDTASRVMDRVRILPLAIISADESVTSRAARLKAAYSLPYADCFAGAVTAKDDILVTADIKGFRKIPGIHLLPLPEHKP